MKIVIVILQYRNFAYTQECIESIKAQNTHGVEIVLVDNASPAGFHEIFEWLGRPELIELNIVYSLYSSGNGIHLIRTTENLGYGQGNNIGAKYAFEELSASHVWILNNDTRLIEGSLRATEVYLKDNIHTDLLGGTLIDYNSDTIQSLGGCTYRPVLGSGKPIGVGKLLKSGLPDKRIVESKLSYLSGASFIISRSLYCKIGLFSPEFFLYFEEIDLAKRAAKFGSSLEWLPQMLVEHKEGASISPEKKSTLSEYHSTLSSLILTAKYYPKLLIFSAGIRSIYKFSRYIPSGRWDLVQAHIKGIHDFLRRKK